MLEKILVPLDGAKLSEMALVPATELAAAFNFELHLLGVCEGRDESHCPLMQGYLEKTADDVRRGIPGKGLNVKPVVLDGEPASRIIDYAVRERMSLIIVVSHGHTGIMPWMIGGTANKIVHGASVPVLLLRAAAVRKKGRQKSIFSKILLPLDGSAAGEGALPYVLEIAGKLESEVTLLSVVESGQRVHTIGGLDFVRFSEEQVRDMENELSAYLDKAVERFRGRNIKARGELRSGHAADEIINFSKTRNIRLVAMSSHGKSGLREWVFGSVSNKVLHADKTHLLLVKPAQNPRP